ncbi:MAG: thiosulfate oxidation carrier protein SoxY [Sulfurimonas sp.]|jgi:sulfur-oxidizing protein SoxY|uniref:thiosulfate oxidation carrier protein SoxY n=1 Tax=unclassified Sulfurimonas TaxID=2623549 RepID=UPI0008CD18B5|nr:MULTISPECIES: thiosulfate oxidation carrier protein SoxY [unclassified Sulfurimonas]OHE08480.1 MAG: thiosulfate oxidation carrier protein SoxY [Sulfurimonas sp. RIFOXYB2_FULL_37_5]OHE08606.1 MAG: thiosulfate oxidation carrier protein SoxY [Sulfurimonas sp. RIFOXYC2_FULL_36_7]OHE17200.1 MAG: thiosulfate oxidation carrier protein SoxY [Sulfurimonas sp. RIFOXYD12_FULL_36_11]MBS4068721.1 thiosulfate oxidation carrier protein SoxY [Sulfurimonas sp.]MDD3854359.1 thiosulfate oxidation carrier prot
MQRRKFLSLGAAAAAVVTVLPSSLTATDFRTTAPKAWEAPTSKEAMEALFGSSVTTEGKIEIKAPKLAENGGAVPIGVKSSVALTTIAIFQDANPRSAVVVFEMGDNGVMDMMTKIKMRKTADVTIVAKGKDGKLYSAVQKVEVSIGGCGG